MNDIIEPLNYTIANIVKIVEKEAKLNMWATNKFDIEVIISNLNNLDFVIDTYACLSDTVINLMQDMWQGFKYNGMYRVLNVTINSKNILNTIRNELIKIGIDCYLFGDIANDCNGYVFMRIQFDHDNPAHSEKLKELKIIDKVLKVEFDIIELNLPNENWSEESWGL